MGAGYNLDLVFSSLYSSQDSVTDTRGFWLCVFRHFDKDKSGRLNHQEFKSCLRSLGYDLPMVEEGEPDPEFESILDTVDPNRYVSWTFLYCKIHGGIGWGVGWKVLHRLFLQSLMQKP